MKKILIMFFIFHCNMAFCTEVSKFVEKQYELFSNCKQVRIIVKQEHTEEYNQAVDNLAISKITYGYGDMKHRGFLSWFKKTRISYICVHDLDEKPLFSWVIPR